MCGRFTLTIDLDAHALASLFGAHARIAAVTPRYNIAPTQPAAVVLADGGRRVLDRLTWGLAPAWAGGRGSGRRLINARAETLSRRPAFRDAFARRRCLVPSDGFYEWGGRPRAPYWIRRGDGAPFAYAGLYERSTFTIITTEPNELVRSLHDRMPVIIHPEAYDRWLDPSPDAAAVRELLRPYPAARMSARPVARTVDRADAEGPACVLPPTAGDGRDDLNLELFSEWNHGQT